MDGHGRRGTAGGDSRDPLMSQVARYRFNTMTDEEILAMKAWLDSR